MGMWGPQLLGQTGTHTFLPWRVSNLWILPHMYAFDLKCGRGRCLRSAISIPVPLITYWVVVDEEV
eukprot:14325304-Ditylum_brightwellii.AAC.1